jgi:hypothetical protein
MREGVILFLIFAILVGAAVFRFENLGKKRKKISGRGGDFDA